MEFLISWWNIESHTFIAAWDERCPTLEGVVDIFGEARNNKLSKDAEEVALDEVGKRKLEAFNKALSNSKSSNKRTYASWTKHYIFGAEQGAM